MVDQIMGNTELGITKAEFISSIVQKELLAKAKMVPTITDISSIAIAGVDTLSFPKLGSFTAVNRVEGVKGDATVVQATMDSMLLDQNAYVAWIVDSKTKKQTSLAIEAELARRSASAHGRYVDNAILAGLKSYAFFSRNAGVPANIDRASMLDMVEALETESDDMDQAVWTFSVDQKKALLNLNDFTANNVFGHDVLFSGEVGKLFGIPVIFHRSLETQQVLLHQKEGLAIGFQSQLAMDSQPANDYGVGATRDAMDQLFGTLGSNLGTGGAAVGKSPLIAKLRD